jgi:hypothetical protein
MSISNTKAAVKRYKTALGRKSQYEQAIINRFIQKKRLIAD